MLQSAAGTAVSESGARATAFILTVSSSMVALGFTVGNTFEDPAEATEALAMLAARRQPEVFSIATTTALITAGIGGIGVALLVVRIAGADSLPIAYAGGVAVLVLLLAAFIVFERARYRDVLQH